jgi:hypothetical protein
MEIRGLTALATEELIDILVSRMRPVRPLRAPALRVAGWVAISAPWVMLVVLVLGIRSDLHARLGDGRWLLELAAAAATAITAAHAAFCAGVPGRGRSWERLVPLTLLAVWLGTLGHGCFAASPAHGLALPDWRCLPAVAVAGLIPGMAIARMISRGVPLAPTWTAALGALAIAATGEVGLQLIYRVDSGLMVLIWQGGAVIGLTVLGACLGSQLVRWRSELP